MPDCVRVNLDERPWGPPAQQQMSREDLDRYMAAGGLKPIKQPTFLPEQYFMEYRVSNRRACDEFILTRDLERSEQAVAAWCRI